MVTLKDVAGESGVSVTTVSMVMSGGPAAARISARTKSRIWRVAKKLGYRPNLFARSLRSQRSHTIGVIVFDVTDPYCTQILRGIETYLRPIGYFSLVADFQNDRTQFHLCADMLLGRRVEGIIAIGNPLYLDSAMFSEFARKGIPAVIIGRELSDSPLNSVVVDNEMGTRQAIQHLYELGHSRIAFIKGPKTLVDSLQRWRGLQSFANEVGLKVDTRLIRQIQGRHPTYEEAFQLTEGLLQRGLNFTALVAFDDLTACGAIRALTEHGYRVPKDCSVVGFDDIPSSAFYNPPLTTVQQQLETQGSLGAEIVENLIKAVVEKRQAPARHRRVSPTLIVRNSTCPAASA
jgi:LacI family transcriptional regulator